MVLAGVRTGDPTEHEYIGKTGIRTVSVENIDVSRLDTVVGPGVTEHAPADGARSAGEAEVIRQRGAALRH